MKKWMCLLLASAVCVVPSVVAPPANVMAAEQSKSGAVQDIDERIIKMIKSDDGPLGWGQYYTDHKIDDFVLRGSNIQSSNIENTEILTVHDSLLTNKLPSTQTMTSAAYEHAFTETTSTTNTTGWTFGYAYNASATVWVVSASHNFSVDYNMSTANTTEKSVQRTLIAPPQNVVVPPYKTYKVNYVFEKMTISGKNNIEADLFGRVFYRNVPDLSYSLGQTWAWAKDKQGFERVNRELNYPYDHWLRNGIRTQGVGEFKTEFGTRLTVVFEDVTDPRNPVVVEKREVPVKFKTISENVREVK
ncbi:ETX/MTX2 family pore-forming toxin [Brevibacillus fortis]|uniref:ETX/MTX2 family pore-forming toxin n=1 Tax=Brevibacillus fortis TaxID=2126352 RepID=UPI002E1D8F9B|nr:ETX/MTX2 family pore-forming toxin [Brevibacillus fortis]